jgi:hypothetical protein
LLLALATFATGAEWGQADGRRACTLGYTNSIFTPSRWPDRSLEEFAQDQLGVIDPRFDPFYLFIAYRRITGKPLTLTDVEHLRRFDPCWDDGSADFYGKYWPGSLVMQAARREWDEARAKLGLPAVPPQNPNTRSAMGHSDRPCRTAIRMLSVPRLARCAPEWKRTPATRGFARGPTARTA